MSAAYEDEKPARELTGLGTPRGGRRLCAGRAVRDLSGVLSARAGQSGFADPVSGGGAAADAVVLPIRTSAPTSCGVTTRHGTPRRRRLAARGGGTWRHACTRLCPSNSQAAEVDSTISSVGRARPRRSTSIVGTVVILLVLEACRRTTGAALPIVCLLALGYAYYGGYLPQGAVIAHAGVDWDQIISASFIQSTGLYGVPLDVAATYIVLFTIYGAVLDASGRQQVLHRPVLRRLPAVQGSAGPDRDPGRVSPRHCFGVGDGDHGQPRVGELAGPAPRRLPEGERGRNAGGRGHRRDPVPADAGRRGLHHRRIPRRALPDGAGLGDRADHPVLPRHPAGRRDRRPPVRRHARSR